MLRTSEKLMKAARSRDDPGQRSYLFYLARYYADIEANVSDTYAKHSFFHCVHRNVESAATAEYCRTAADSLAVYGTYNMKTGKVVFHHLVKLLEARKVMNSEASDRPLLVARSLLEHGAESEQYYDCMRSYLEERRDAMAGSSAKTDKFFEDILQTFDPTTKYFFRKYPVFEDPFRELFPRDLLVPSVNDFEVYYGPYKQLFPRAPVPFDLVERRLPMVVPRVEGPENDPHDVSHIKDAVAEARRLRSDARKRKREYEERDGVICID